MARFRLCVLIYVVAVALVEYGFADAIQREECTTSGCMRTVSNFMNTFLWDWNACNRFYHFTCGAYRGETSPYPEIYEHTATSLAHQLNNLKLDGGVKCPWPQCVTRHEDRAAAQYESSCSKQDESSNDVLKDFVEILNEANKIEKWTDLENWSVSQGLESSFFKTYSAGYDNSRYHEVTADADPPTNYVQHQDPIVVDPDTVIIDPRPDMHNFLGANEIDRVKTYIQLLKAVNLSDVLEANLLDGFEISSHLDKKLTEEHKKSNPDEHVLNFFRQRYTKKTGTGNSTVQWQHLWDCGLFFMSFDGDAVCESDIVQKFDWTSYFRDHYWGSAAVSRDLVPLLERELPEHWVVAPDLISTMSLAIHYYTNQRMKNIILWRMARQLTRHIDSISKSTLRLRGSYYDCHSTFSKTIMRLKSRYNWYDRFPEYVRMQFYEMWADVNFQMKYLRFKRLYEEGKCQEHEEVKSLMLVDYTNTEYYPQFPHASKYVEPKIAVKETRSNRTTLDIALNLQKIERSLLLQVPRVEYSYEDTYYLVETLGTGKFARFMEDRPASLNFGALGSAIGYNLLTRFIDPWRNNLNFFNNYKECVDKNFPGFIGNNNTKLHELASIMFGMEAAWYAYERHVALNGDKNLKMPPGRAGEVLEDDITLYDNKQLFFASFGNSLCEGMHSKELINVAVQMLPQFREAFGCKQNPEGAEWVDCKFD